MKKLVRGKIVCLFVTVASLVSCEKKVGPVVIEKSINVLVLDEESNNLLESDRFNIDDLKIYYLINGEKKLYFQENLIHPKGYMINKSRENQTILTIILNDDLNSPVTLIQYKESDTDTIKSEFLRRGPSIFTRKVWYNDELKWDFINDTNGLRTFSITKKSYFSN